MVLSGSKAESCSSQRSQIDFSGLIFPNLKPRVVDKAGFAHEEGEGEVGAASDQGQALQRGGVEEFDVIDPGRRVRFDKILQLLFEVRGAKRTFR